MPSRKHHHYLTFAGKVATVVAALAVGFLLLFEFWPNAEQHVDLSEARTVASDLARVDDLKPLQQRLSRLELLLREREQLQRQTVAAISETRVRLRTLEDQLGMLQLNTAATRDGVDEIRVMLREHMIKSKPLLDQYDEQRDEEEPPPKSKPIIPGTVH